MRGFPKMQQISAYHAELRMDIIGVFGNPLAALDLDYNDDQRD